MEDFLQCFQCGAMVVGDAVAVSRLTASLGKPRKQEHPDRPIAVGPLSSASSQMMNRAPPCLYWSDSRIRGTFCESHVSALNVLFLLSSASHGEIPSWPSWQRFGVMKLYCAAVWLARSVAS